MRDILGKVFAGASVAAFAIAALSFFGLFILALSGVGSQYRTPQISSLQFSKGVAGGTVTSVYIVRDTDPGFSAGTMLVQTGSGRVYELSGTAPLQMEATLLLSGKLSYLVSTPTAAMTSAEGNEVSLIAALNQGYDLMRAMMVVVLGGALVGVLLLCVSALFYKAPDATGGTVPSETAAA